MQCISLNGYIFFEFFLHLFDVERWCFCSRIRTATTGVTIVKMNPKLKKVDINNSTEEVIKCTDRFNFSIDTRKTNEENVIKGAFLMVVRKE